MNMCPWNGHTRNKEVKELKKDGNPERNLIYLIWIGIEFFKQFFRKFIVLLVPESKDFSWLITVYSILQLTFTECHLTGTKTANSLICAIPTEWE